jgi:hypothetical protein
LFTRQLPPIPRDKTPDVHDSVWPAWLPEWAKEPPVAERLRDEFGWDGEIPVGFVAAQAMVEYLRSHALTPGGPSLIDLLTEGPRGLVRLGLVGGIYYRYDHPTLAGQRIPPEPIVQPPAPPAPTPAKGVFDMRDPSYPVNHANSAAMQPSPERDAVYDLEIAHQGYTNTIELARSAGVLTPEDEKNLNAAKANLRKLYDRAKTLYDARQAVGNAAQAEADAVWNTTHAVRERWARAKMTGYDAPPPYGPNATFFNSDLDRTAWEALSGMSGAAGSLGLQGELKRSSATGVERRDAHYVDALSNISSQDPVATKLGGEAGGSGTGAVSIGGVFG